MKKQITLSLYTLVVAFISISVLQAQETNKVLLFIRDGSPDLEFMLKEEVGVMKETLETAGFKVDIATLTGEPISAGSIKIRPDLKLKDVSVFDYDGFILPCMGSDTPVPDEVIMLVKEFKGKPIAAQVSSIRILAAAGQLKGKNYASAIEFDSPTFEGSIRIGTGVVNDGNIITSGICPMMARRDKNEDGTEELASTLAKAIKTGAS